MADTEPDASADAERLDAYRHVLIAVDLTESTPVTVGRGCHLAGACGATVSLAHVIEQLPFSYGVDLSAAYSNLREDLHQWASNELHRLGESHGIAPQNCHLVGGRASLAIREIADSLTADLIVIGSHVRQPLAAPFGSTVHGILHHARCDVLTVQHARADKSAT